MSIVTGCNVLGAESIGMVQKLSKFYFSIAQYVGVGCASSLVLLKKDLENSFPVFVLKVNGMQGNVKLPANTLCDFKILSCGTVRFVVVFLPVLHEQSDDVVALLLKPPGCNR